MFAIFREIVHRTKDVPGDTLNGHYHYYLWRVLLLVIIIIIYHQTGHCLKFTVVSERIRFVFV